jgi:hypothetical protein
MLTSVGFVALIGVTLAVPHGPRYVSVRKNLCSSSGGFTRTAYATSFLRLTDQRDDLLVPERGHAIVDNVLSLQAQSSPILSNTASAPAAM